MSPDTLPDTLARTAGPPTLLVVSDSFLGPTLAAGVAPRDDVRLVTHDRSIAARAPEGTDVAVGDVTDLDTLSVAAGADVAVVCLRTDREALLATQLLRTRFGIEAVVVVVNDPDRRETMADVATAVVSAPECLSAEVRGTIATAAGAADR